MDKRYHTLVADPPWQFRMQLGRIRPRYDLMDLASIKRIPIPQMAAQNSHLYLWVPNAFICEAMDIMSEWGFSHKTTLTWAKYNLGMGNSFRNSTEHVLFGIRGRLPVLRRDVGTWFLARGRQHSRKPDEFYRIVESMSPGPRIDVFSREVRLGWDQWGNQCDFFNQSKGDSNERKQTVETDGSSRDLGCGINDALRMDERKKDSVS